jgi:hypothetical protein
MSKLTAPRRPPLSPLSPLSRRALAALSLAAFVIFAPAAWRSRSAEAQSGRRRPAPASPAPAATPSPEAQGESESVPRGAAKKAETVVSFVVVENDNVFLSLDSVSRGEITETFLRRLGQSGAVSVKPAGRGSRKEARDRAKAETEAFVVLFELEEDRFGSSPGVGREDARTLVIRTSVFEPKTAGLKYTDTIHQRPYRETATVGGIRIPVPGRRVERYPSELQLKQAAADAADRLMRRFNIILPPER